MSPCWQSRNVPFYPRLGRVHVNVRVSVKRRRALVATNPIKDPKGWHKPGFNVSRL